MSEINQETNKDPTSPEIVADSGSSKNREEEVAVEQVLTTEKSGENTPPAEEETQGTHKIRSPIANIAEDDDANTDTDTDVNSDQEVEEGKEQVET